MTRPKHDKTSATVRFTFSKPWIHGGKEYAAGAHEDLPASTAAMLAQLGAGDTAKSRSKARSADVADGDHDTTSDETR